MLQTLEKWQNLLKHVPTCKGSHKEFTLIEQCMLHHRCKGQKHYVL